MKLNADEFKGLSDMFEYENSGIYKYTTGKFENKKDAMERQNDLRNNGYKDAFVVAFKNGIRIHLK